MTLKGGLSKPPFLFLYYASESYKTQLNTQYFILFTSGIYIGNDAYKG